MAKEIECEACDEPILESETRYKLTITDSGGLVMDHLTICECCLDEVNKALGNGDLS